MKILFVNKFLYSVGGSETYIFELGQKYVEMGDEVQYFGLADSRNIVGNIYDIYVNDYRKIKIVNPLKLIYSKKAKQRMTEMLDKYCPDIVHFNNISYDLTSSVIEACKKKNVPCVMTIHDPQLICPNHRLFIERDSKICEDCLTKGFFSCVKNRCIKDSFIKSLIGYFEAKRNAKFGYYDYLSAYICPSQFIADKLAQGGYERSKLKVIRNFSNCEQAKTLSQKEDYALYFGRLGKEKGIELMLKALPKNKKLIIAGKGPLENEVRSNKQIEYVGFKSGNELKDLISKARFTIYPSIWYENSPFSIIESISLGTPVLGSNLGGIPELIQNNVTGLLFESGNEFDLRDKMEIMFTNDPLIESLSNNCLKSKIVTSIAEYAQYTKELYINILNA